MFTQTCMIQTTEDVCDGLKIFNVGEFNLIVKRIQRLLTDSKLTDFVFIQTMYFTRMFLIATLGLPECYKVLGTRGNPNFFSKRHLF